MDTDTPVRFSTSETPSAFAKKSSNPGNWIRVFVEYATAIFDILRFSKSLCSIFLPFCTVSGILSSTQG